VTRFSVAVSLQGSTESRQGSANLFWKLSDTLLGFRKPLPGSLNSYLNLGRFPLGFQKSYKGTREIPPRISQDRDRCSLFTFISCQFQTAICRLRESTRRSSDGMA